MGNLLPQNMHTLLGLLPLNCHSLLEFLKLLSLNGHSLNEFLRLLSLNGHCLNDFLKHLDAVSLLNLTLLSCWEGQLREICRRIEQGIAFNVFFILDVERFPPINISDTTFVDFSTGVMQSFSFWVLFVKEFCEFSLELPLIDPIHHCHKKF
jgi:hypothetical protein